MKLIVANPAKIYMRRGVVRIRAINGGEQVVDSTVDAVIVATSRVLVTAKAIRMLASMGIDLVFLARNGEPVARVWSPVINRTVLARRGQYEAMLDGRGFKVAKMLTYAKIRNQANLIRYMAKSRRIDELKDEAIKLEEIASYVESARDASEVMEVEAHAARHYWQA